MSLPTCRLRTHLSRVEAERWIGKAARVRGADPLLLFAPYVSRPMGERLREAGGQYVDELGNVFLQSAALDALAQRIVVRANVRGVARDEMGAYLAHRLKLAGNAALEAGASAPWPTGPHQLEPDEPPSEPLAPSGKDHASLAR